jgi:hypothetical protein
MIAPGDVQPGCPFDSLEPRRGVDLHDDRPLGALEHVDPCDSETHDLSGAYGGVGVHRIEIDGLDAAAAVDIGTELVTAGLPAHRCHHAIADHEGPNIASPAFGHKPLDEDVLTSGLKRFDDRLGDLGIRGENHPDSLRALEQLDHDGSTADAVDRRQHVGPVAHKRRGRDGDVVSGEDLNRTKLVPRVRNAVGGSRCVHVHLLELANDGEPKERDRCTDTGRTASKSSS